MATIKTVVQAALECADSGAKMTEVLRDYMAGIPANKRDEKVKEIYTVLRTVDGKMMKTAELPERNKRAYDACRQAYGRLFPKGKRSGRKIKAGKVTVTKVTGAGKAQIAAIAAKPKKLSDTLKVILATIQAEEKPAFQDVPKLIAALQVAIDLSV